MFAKCSQKYGGTAAILDCSRQNVLDSRTNNSPKEAVMFDSKSPQTFSGLVVCQLVCDHLRVVLNLTHRHMYGGYVRT